MADDTYEYATTDDGVQLRSCIWESSSLPITWVKWNIQRFYPEYNFWRTLQRSECPWERAYEIVPMRLKEWVNAFNDGMANDD